VVLRKADSCAVWEGLEGEKRGNHLKVGGTHHTLEVMGFCRHSFGGWDNYNKKSYRPHPLPLRSRGIVCINKDILILHCNSMQRHATQVSQHAVLASTSSWHHDSFDHWSCCRDWIPHAPHWHSLCQCVCVNHLNRCKTLNFQFTKAGASGPSYLPDATKLWYEGEG